MLYNVQHLIADLGEQQAEVALVANGGGISALVRSGNGHRARIEKLAEQGVQLLACANSLRFLGLDEDELLDPVEVVPAGVSELTKKQAKGWAYIRP